MMACNLAEMDHEPTGPTPSLPADSVALVTVSYRGDLTLAQDLCASVDRWADPAIEHVLVVPRADRERFLPLTGERRRLVTVESVLPHGYRRLPVPHQLRIGPWSRLIREIWVGGGRLVRGWMMQQVVKLNAPLITGRDVIVFADSDIVLVRPVSPADFVSHARTVLYRVPEATKDSASHRSWHAAAGRLLGLPPSDYFGADYIGNLISWRRDDVLALQRALSSDTRSWDAVLVRERALSEYILYGIFVEHVRGFAAAGHEPSSRSLVHAGWHYDLTTSAGIAEFVDAFTDRHLAVAIQSTQQLTLSQRRALVDRMTSRSGP